MTRLFLDECSSCLASLDDSLHSSYRGGAEPLLFSLCSTYFIFFVFFQCLCNVFHFPFVNWDRGVLTCARRFWNIFVLCIAWSASDKVRSHVLNGWLLILLRTLVSPLLARPICHYSSVSLAMSSDLSPATPNYYNLREWRGGGGEREKWKGGGRRGTEASQWLTRQKERPR